MTSFDSHIFVKDKPEDLTKYIVIKLTDKTIYLNKAYALKELGIVTTLQKETDNILKLNQPQQEPQPQQKLQELENQVNELDIVLDFELFNALIHIIEYHLGKQDISKGNMNIFMYCVHNRKKLVEGIVYLEVNSFKDELQFIEIVVDCIIDELMNLLAFYIGFHAMMKY